jgi:hypothetical protein
MSQVNMSAAGPSQGAKAPPGGSASEVTSVGAILPGATLGVMGGGQLGRMFAHAAQQMGYFTAVLDADPTSPAGLVSHHHVQTGYEDAAGLAELARLSAAVTTEFENVPARPAGAGRHAACGAWRRRRGRGAGPRGRKGPFHALWRGLCARML